MNIKQDNLIDKKVLDAACPSAHRLFKPDSEAKISALLSYTAAGDQAEVERFSDLEAFSVKANVEDYSHRKFKNISAYQYAL
jgi:hypothetical protein